MKKLFIIISVIFFLSCNNGEYYQYYAEYSDFEKITNKRLTGWFPKIITNDSYEIQSSFYLDICAFTSVKYKKLSSVDSIFNLYKSITVNDFKITTAKYQSKIPNWFLPLEKIDDVNFEAVELNKKLFALREKKTNRIYSISSIKYK
ncbi:hypothetical protein [Flavobacterium macrobrachii]|uniref:hypothetical protein n=1 Tax=Flavobacterium macrobrachii TaxID=591204 RepID=UPI003F6F7FCE